MADASNPKPSTPPVEVLGFLHWLSQHKSSCDDSESISQLSAEIQRVFSVNNTHLLSQQTLSAEPVPGTVPYKVATHPLFATYVDTLTTRGAFDGLEIGSEEYNQKIAKAAATFGKKVFPEDDTVAAPAVSPAAASATPVSADAAASAAAEKALGNAALSEGDAASAVEHYSKAIELVPSGADSHIFYANRAAAYLRLEDAANALEDARMATHLQPDYVKGWNRLGQAALKLDDLAEARAAYEQALALDSSNAVATAGLQIIRTKDSEGAAVSSPGADTGAVPPGMPDLSNLMGPGGLGGLMNNPAFAQAAQNLMSNPQLMQQMAGMAQSMFAGGAGGAGGMPDMSALASMFGGAGAPGAGPSSPAEED